MAATLASINTKLDRIIDILNSGTVETEQPGDLPATGPITIDEAKAYVQLKSIVRSFSLDFDPTTGKAAFIFLLATGNILQRDAKL